MIQMLKKAGAAPGTLVHLGDKKLDRVRIRVIDYSPDSISEEELDDIKDAARLNNTDSVSWINVDGLHDVSVFEQIGKDFDIHPLILEDCLNTRQRPKLDDHESYLFIVMKMFYLNKEKVKLEREQISFLVGPGYVLSFQEKEGDVFALVRDRIRQGKGRIRSQGSDYLAYALIDAVVDHYFHVIDYINEKVDSLDAKVIEQPTPEVLQEVYVLKREIVSLRKHVTPLRDLLSRLAKGDPSFISDDTELYFDDVLDHALQVLESIDAHREILSGLIDLYLSSVSNRMNEIMKVLTIMAAIFIPITFVAGVYGMNFEVIPELKWKFGYFYVWSLMISIAGGMIVYFKVKKWM